jgi:hypothetical protein
MHIVVVFQDESAEAECPQASPVHRYRKDVLHEDGEYAVTCSFFGDGTCNVGQFYECLNMAALYKLPHIFVVENNKWAIGMSHARSTSSTAGDEYPYIYKKGPAFGMPSVYVDGMDVVKVRSVAKEAVERARRGEGPTLIEAETYRFRGHSLADPDELRSKDEKAAYNVRIHQNSAVPGRLPMTVNAFIDAWVVHRCCCNISCASQTTIVLFVCSHCCCRCKLVNEARNSQLFGAQARDPLPAFQKFCKENGLLSDDDFKEIDDEVTKVIEDAVEFSDESPRPEKGQLLENVFADPKGFGIGPDGQYRYLQPGFTSGAVQVS